MIAAKVANARALDYPAGRLEVIVACDGSPCLRPEGRVELVATARVPLPLVPDFLRDALPTVVPVSATHVATVDRFRGR